MSFPPFKSYCPRCDAVTWHYNNVCKWNYLHMVIFDLTVEPTDRNPELVLHRLRWDGPAPPDLVWLSGTVLIKVGRYASHGGSYQYRVASAARLSNGRLVAITNPDLNPSSPEAA